MKVETADFAVEDKLVLTGTIVHIPKPANNSHASQLKQTQVAAEVPYRSQRDKESGDKSHKGDLPGATQQLWRNRFWSQSTIDMTHATSLWLFRSQYLTV